jgi:hypothetical protein
MLTKGVRFAVLLGVAVTITLLMARHAQPSSLNGRWRDQSPAALLYEFREDGSVWLIGDRRDLPVWRYEISGDVVEFHDGMGRPRAYRFALDDDRLTLSELESGAVEEYRREP